MTVKMKLGDRFQLYLHAGESYSRNNTELYDAILLGTKRIGHGFGLSMPLLWNSMSLALKDP